MSDGYADEGPSVGSESGFNLSYLPSIFWQRRWWLVIPVILGTLAGVAAALLIPPRYQSRATLLVESPQMQEDLVGDKSTASAIDRRIAKVKAQIFSRPDLVELIQNNNLYAKERQSEPLSKIVEKMRAATSLTPVSADIGGGDRGSNTIAFSLSFDYEDPQRAQLVAQDFVERLVKLDASQTAEQASGNVEFLQEQANNLAKQVNEIESNIRTLKSSNGAALANSGTMMLSTGGGYQAQIAQLQRENSQLTVLLNQSTQAADRDPAVVAAEAQLAGARATYSDNHPDVRLAEQRLSQAKAFAAGNARRFDNTAVIRSQIASNNSAIASLSAAQSSEQGRAGAIMSAQARAPAINEQVAQLQAKADGLRENYQAISTRLLNARGAATLSDQQRGERLTVIDPPVTPEEPVAPNRPLVAALGLIGGLGFGVFILLAIELIKRPIRGSGPLARITGVPPLAIIPTIDPIAAGGRNWKSLFRIRRKKAA